MTSNNSPSTKLKAYYLRPQLLKTFLEEFIIRFSQGSISGQYVYDETLKRNCIFTNEEGYSQLKLFFQERLFFKRGPRLDLYADKYLVRRVQTETSLDRGVQVLFLLDGNLYDIVQLSTDKQKATIKNKSSGMLLKVKSNLLRRKE